jgi:hypothetical protein
MRGNHSPKPSTTPDYRSEEQFPQRGRLLSGYGESISKGCLEFFYDWTEGQGSRDRRGPIVRSIGDSTLTRWLVLGFSFSPQRSAHACRIPQVPQRHPSYWADIAPLSRTRIVDAGCSCGGTGGRETLNSLCHSSLSPSFIPVRKCDAEDSTSAQALSNSLLDPVFSAQNRQPLVTFEHLKGLCPGSCPAR